MDFSSFEAFTSCALIVLEQYGFILVLIFAFIHPIIEGPLALFTLTLGIALMGAVPAYISIFICNILGFILLYYMVQKGDKFSNYYLHRKKVSSDILTWLKETKKWKHIFVLGVPIIPTYPVKIGYLLSEPRFKDAIKTMVGSYLFLFFGNTLIYYGFLNIFESGASRIISVILLVLLVVYVYFGNDVFQKIKRTKRESI